MKVPKQTIRLRLTVALGAAFIAAAGLLLVLNYALVVNAMSGSTDRARENVAEVVSYPETRGGQIGIDNVREAFTIASEQQADETLSAVRHQSFVALLTLTAPLLAFGWFMAGRLLRPIHQISTAAERISHTNLRGRINLTGPDDELTRLAATFDELLDRLEQSYNNQQAFAAHASHELRTPLTMIRTVVDVTFDDPERDAADYDAMRHSILGAVQRSATLIDRLLELAQAQQRPQLGPIDLAAVAEECLASVDTAGLRIIRQLEPAVTEGDPALWHQLTMNLITNAARHNSDDGWIKIETCHDGEHARLAVSNSGPIVDPDRIEALRDPFVQGSSTQQGHGLGLAIVDAIANAHHTVVHITARPEGGLAVTANAPQYERV